MKTGIILPLMVVLALLSNNLMSASIGTFQFLKLPAHAQDGALAGSSLTIAEGNESLFVNPANLARSKGLDASISYNAWILQMSYFSGSVAFPLGTGRVGIGGILFSAGKQDVIENYQVVGQNANSDFAAIVGYGVEIRNGFSVGSTLKAVSGNLLEERITLGLMDLGVSLKLLDKMDIAIDAKNIGFSRMPIPAKIQAGLAYSILKENFTFTPILCIDCNSDSANGFSLAFSGDYKRFASLRMGYNHKWGEEGFFMNDGVRLGVGVNWKGISCDLGLTPMGPFGQTVMVSISFKK